MKKNNDEQKISQDMSDLLDDISIDQAFKSEEKVLDIQSLESKFNLTVSLKPNTYKSVINFYNVSLDEVKNTLSYQVDHIKLLEDPNAPLFMSRGYSNVEEAIELKRHGHFAIASSLYKQIYEEYGPSHVLCKAWGKTAALNMEYDLAIKLMKIANYIQMKHNGVIDVHCIGGATIILHRNKRTKEFQNYLVSIKGKI